MLCPGEHTQPKTIHAEIAAGSRILGQIAVKTAKKPGKA
jgi:hypothetical protein